MFGGDAMSGIHVLSDILKGGNKLEKTVTPEGQDSSESSGSVAEIFSAMLSGLMMINVDSKGQNSKASVETEEKQSAGNPVPSVQKPNGEVSMLGYGNFVLTNLLQPMLQSDLPAGKEANSGNDEFQGTLSLANAKALLTNVPNVSGNNIELATLNVALQVSEEDLTSTGMATSNPQGANPGLKELDKYRQVISDLLVALSGKITDVSPEGASEGLERRTSERQELMKLIQGWLNVTDDGVNYTQAAPSAHSTVGQGIVEQIYNGQSIVGQSNNGHTFSNLDRYAPLPQVGSENLEEQPHSKNVNSLSPNSGVEDLRQIIARMVQGLTQGTVKVAVGVPDFSVPSSMFNATPRISENEVFSEQKVIKLVLDFLATEQGDGGTERNTKASALGVALNQLLSQIQETNVSQEAVKELPKVKSDRGEALLNQPKSGSPALETAIVAGRETFLQPDFKQKITDLVNSKPSNNVQGIVSEESIKGVVAEATELSGVKATQIQNQNPSVGIGFVGNITTGNVIDGKTVAIPVWEQISNVFKQQVTNRLQELKELDIKLHPADLGRIQIGLRWENGQVHLIVHASEPATGQMLQNQLLELRHTLTNQGVNCGTLQMGQPGGDQQQTRQENESRRTLESNTNSSDEEEVSPSANLFSTRQDGNNRLNVTA